MAEITFKSLDKDRDGQLSREEMQGLIVSRFAFIIIIMWVTM